MSDQAIRIQHQIRANATELAEYVQDLRSWEVKANNGQLKTKKKVETRVREVGTIKVINKNNNNENTAEYKAFQSRNDIFNVNKSNDNNNDNDNDKLTVPKARGNSENIDGESLERQRGNTLYEQGNFASAVKSYTTCLGMKVNNYVAFSNRAMAYIKLKEYGKAEKDCTCALSIDPMHVKSMLRRATAKNAVGKHRSAIDDLKMALELDNGNKLAKSDLIKSKEALRNAVNRAPMIKVLSEWEL